MKKDDSTLIFKVDESNLNDFNYSTVTVPEGKHYKVVIADELSLWLNAPSSLSFRSES